MLIDTHTHIYSDEFKGDIDEIINRSLANGVEKLLLPNIDSSSIKPMLDLVEKFKNNCFPMMGIHPTSVKEDYEEELELVHYWLEKQTFCAIGEIGIDLYWDATFKKEQEYVFRHQLELAQKWDLPVVIHTRDSFDVTYENLMKVYDGNMKGVFHCFTGTVEQAKKVLAIGFKIGVGGIVTFKNSGIDKMVAQLKPEDIVLETDAPYLAPTPYRGKRNESSYLSLVAKKVSEIFDVSVEEIESITSSTAIDLFQLDS